MYGMDDLYVVEGLEGPRKDGKAPAWKIFLTTPYRAEAERYADNKVVGRVLIVQYTPTKVVREGNLHDIRKE